MAQWLRARVRLRVRVRVSILTFASAFKDVLANVGHSVARLPMVNVADEVVDLVKGEVAPQFDEDKQTHATFEWDWPTRKRSVHQVLANPLVVVEAIHETRRERKIVLVPPYLEKHT